MNRTQKNRLYTLLIILAALGLAVGFLLYALRQNINLFYTPTTAVEANLTSDQVIRIGGFVEDRSVHFSTDGKTVTFKIQDKQHSLPVKFEGVLPTLFREGQGVVITGILKNKTIFIANEVLAKHDEKYRPKV